jgi:hypothetical protein
MKILQFACLLFGNTTDPKPQPNPKIPSQLVPAGEFNNNQTENKEK